MSKRLFIAYFENEEDILGVTRAARESGYDIRDVFSPYAVHGLDKAMGLRPSRLPWICLGFALLGAAAKLWFQIWTSAFDWPVNVGGKPMASIPAFVPVTFEISVLFAGLGTVAAFFLISRLRPGKKPAIRLDRATNDRYVLILVENDAGFDASAAAALCKEFRCVHFEERLEDEQ
ncbi:MAG: DUF3341 domain-containing protein [Bacteroidota bacterium]